jgi:hypothetical protein
MMYYLIRERLNLGREKYGHGVRVNDNTSVWGTSRDSWLEMAIEEYLDAIVYTVADYIKKYEEASSDCDDNLRILQLSTNPEEMTRTTFHARAVKCLHELVYSSQQ